MCHPPAPGLEYEPVESLQQIALTSGADQIAAWLALPPGDAPAPGIVVLSDMFGPTPFHQQVTAQLATAGYVVLLPDLFSREAPLPAFTTAAGRARLERLPDRLVEQDCAAAIEFLKAHPRVAAGRIGTIGFCMGGTWVLLLSALRDDVRAGVCIYGFPVQREQAEWKIYEPVALVERFSHPILGLWGDQDASVPLAHVERLRAELKRHGKPHEIVVYPGAHHSFMLPPETITPQDNDPPSVAADAWARTFTFFRQHLGG